MKSQFLILFLFILKVGIANDNINNLKKAIFKDYYSQNYTDAIQKSYALIEICKSNKNKKELAFAYENLGVFYSEICDYKTAMNYYSKALNNINFKSDKKYYFSIILNIGTTLLDANNNKDAIYYFKRAKHFFNSNKTNNYSRLICCYTNLGIAYQNLNKLNYALEYNRIAIKIAKKQYLLDQFSGPLINMCDIYFKLNKLPQALKYYDDAIFYLESNKDNLGLWHAKIGKANVYAQQNKKKEAIGIYKKALSYFLEIKSLKDVIFCYDKLSDFSFQCLDYTNAYLFKSKEMIYIDSLKNEENTNAISNIKVQLEIAKKNEKIKLNRELILKEKKITNLLFLSVILLIIIIIILFYIYRNKQNILKNESNEKERISKIDNALLSNKLKNSEKELQTFALHIIQKNEFIENIKDEIILLKKSKSEEISGLISKLILKLNSTYKKNKELELFLGRVEEVNLNFYNLLSTKFPNLTQNEKKLCALIKLNLSSKDIALLSNISLGAVTMARYRLRTKINIEKDENLAEFLINLS